MSGYRFELWLAWMDEHATRRADGRVTHLDGALLPESHRNTLASWLASRELIPLGRWDEILVAAGLVLVPDFEQWLEAHHGSDGYVSDDCATLVVD